MSFFSNAKNFKITGGEFNDVRGDVNHYHEYTTYATTGSYNSGAGDHPSTGPGRRHTQFQQPPNNAYTPRAPDRPGRSQSSTFPHGDQTAFPGQNGGRAPPQSQSPMGYLPDPRVRSPEDEVSAQFRSGGARNNHLPQAPPLQSAWSAPQPQSQYSYDVPVSVAPWPGPGAPPARSMPMPQPNNWARRQRQNTGNDVLSSSPEDAPSWPSRPAPPPNGQPPRRSQTANLPIQTMGRSRHSIPRPVRRQTSDEEMHSSGSDSEHEDTRPRASRQPSQTSQGDRSSQRRF